MKEVAKKIMQIGDAVSSGEPKITHKDDYTYRVCIEEGTIRLQCFGLPTVDSNCEGDYDSVDALPDWVQDRLAILMMTPTTKPTSDIPTVGRRISRNVFWVYAPEHIPDEKSRP